MPQTAIRQEKYRDPNPVVSFVIRRFFDRVRAMVDGVAPRSVLDAGCGEGELLRRGVLPAGIPPVSLDLRLESLADARNTAGGGRFVCGSVLSLPFAAGSFDVVLCLEVLEHLDQPLPAVHELARVARKAVILSVPYEPYFRIGNVMRGKHLSRLGDHPEHVQHWNFRTFGSFLSSVPGRVDLVEAFPWIIACCHLSNR